VTHELEEFIPPLSPSLAPTELKDDHLHINKSPLGLNSFEAAACPEPEIFVRQSLPTRSTQPHADNQLNLETQVPTSLIPEPYKDIYTLARLLANQLYQHHGCCDECHEQAHTAHQETHPVHTGLRDYVDQININRDFPDVLSVTIIATRESNLAQQVTTVQKQQVYCGINP
jgi:hypothetical protein